MAKSVKLQEDTKLLLNEAKAIYIKESPHLNNHTDDSTIHLALKEYIKNRRKS